KRHVSGQGPHSLQALLILGRLADLASVDTVPVLAGGHRHTADGKILVQLIKGGRQPASSGGHHTGSHFHGLIKGGAEKQPVQERNQSAVGRCVINGTSDHQPITGFKFRSNLIDAVVKHAFPFGGTCPASDTSPD